MIYIVNISFMVAPRIHDAWLESLRKEFVPRLDSKEFGTVTFCRVLTDRPEGHFTYSLQIETKDMSGYQRIVHEILHEYSESAHKLFGEDLMYFTSVLKKIEL